MLSSDYDKYHHAHGRFSKENKQTNHPFAWLPFGAGPHNCIGMRFALMETKMAIARVLQKFRLETCPETEVFEVFRFFFF